MSAESVQKMGGTSIRIEPSEFPPTFVHSPDHLRLVRHLTHLPITSIAFQPDRDGEPPPPGELFSRRDKQKKMQLFDRKNNLIGEAFAYKFDVTIRE